MRSSILIAVLVVAISSSTHGVDNIFGVRIDQDQLHTLRADRVATETQSKLDILRVIEELTQKVPTNERAWLVEFKKLITAEREIIAKLHVSLTHLNTDILENINDDDLKKQISDEVFAKLQKGLQNYVSMLKNFDLSPIVWEGRSFLGNPFEEFLGKITAANPEGLKAATLKAVFKKAAAEVSTAKSNIFAIVASFTKNLEPQKKQSQIVMTEIRNLNHLAVPLTEKKVKQSVNKLQTKLKKLQRSIENVNKVAPTFQCFMQKRAWVDEIRTQLINIDKVHTKLKIELVGV